MPIAAKLSRRLDEVLGSEAAEAMVDWMHRIDASRSELRELNDLNYARTESRFREIDERFRGVDVKLDAVAAALNSKIESQGAELRLEMQSGFSRLETMM